MNKKTFIDKFRTMFSQVEEGVTEETFIDGVTADGLTLRIKDEEIVEGVQVYVVGEDGEEAPAPEGEHEIEGKVIVTDAEGKVVEVKDAETEEEETPEAPEATDVVEEEEMTTEVVVASATIKLESAADLVAMETEEIELESEVKSLADRMSALELAIANIAESMSSVESLEKEVAKLSGLPADAEIKLSKASGDKLQKLNDREAKLKFLSKRK